jgi:hypothetical protein
MYITNRGETYVSGNSLPVAYRDLPSTALDQTGTFQLLGGIRNGRPLDTQHLPQQALSDQQYVVVTSVTHHEQPSRKPLLEAVGAVAGYRDHDLLEKGLEVSVHQTSKRWHRLHSSCERSARHPCCSSRQLHE